MSNIVIPDGSKPFFLLRPHDGDRLISVIGEKQTFDKLKDIPRGINVSNDACTIVYDNITLCVDTVSMLPFAQIRERGFRVNRERGEDIITIKAESAVDYHLKDFTTKLQSQLVPVELEGDIKFDVSEEEFSRRIKQIIDKEFQNSEGSNFVTVRKATSKVKKFSIKTALSIFHRMLTTEYGTYWTYIFYDGGDNLFIGASPERHMLIKGDLVMMNPISGNFRKYSKTESELRLAMEKFLLDNKERDALWMVCDEALKMMTPICPGGGEIVGPRLLDVAEMSFSEYELVGNREIDEEGIAKMNLADCLKATLFSPSFIGTPIGNVCARLFENERKSRGFYSSACVMMGTRVDEPLEGAHSDYLDSCITVRTSEYKLATGDVTIRSNAVVSKDLNVEVEMFENDKYMKNAFKSITGDPSYGPPPFRLSDAYFNSFNRARLSSALSSRNKAASPFWMQRSDAGEFENAEYVSALPDADDTLIMQRGRALVMSNDDDAAVMITYMLKKLGIEAELADFNKFYELAWGPNASYYDLFVIGPGPGNPNDLNSIKMRKIRKMIDKLLDQNSNRVLAIGLGHQMIAVEAGLSVMRKDTTRTSEQKLVELFDGSIETLGFYHSNYVRLENVFHLSEEKANDPKALKAHPFKADVPATQQKYCAKLGAEDPSEVELAHDKLTGEIFGVRIRGRFVSFSFHPESVMSASGFKVLRESIDVLLERRRKRQNGWWNCC